MNTLVTNLNEEAETVSLPLKLTCKTELVSVSVSGSPGSGKTALIEAALAALQPECRTGVIIGTAVTTGVAQRFSQFANYAADVKADDLAPSRIKDILAAAPLDQLDLLLIESVGNVGAELGIGNVLHVGVFSVSGGDDKAAKFPERVINADLIVLTKVDLLRHVHFDLRRFRADVRRLNPSAAILEFSEPTREGIVNWADWLRSAMHRPTSRSADRQPSAPEWFFG